MIELHPGEICDFCSSKDITKVYPCKSFKVAGIEMFGVDVFSRNEWDACAICTALIESKSWSELMERVLTTNPNFQAPYTDTERKALRPFILGLHQQFQQNRIGEGQPAVRKSTPQEHALWTGNIESEEEPKKEG
jgi:hypothetical protein